MGSLQQPTEDAAHLVVGVTLAVCVADTQDAFRVLPAGNTDNACLALLLVPCLPLLCNTPALSIRQGVHWMQGRAVACWLQVAGLAHEMKRTTFKAQTRDTCTNACGCLHALPLRRTPAPCSPGSVRSPASEHPMQSGRLTGGASPSLAAPHWDPSWDGKQLAWPLVEL